MTHPGVPAIRIQRFLFPATLLVLALSSAMASSHRIYLGTYTRSGPSRGIYAVSLDRERGTLSAPELVAEATDPAWVVLTPDRRRLYTIHASTQQAIGFAVSAESAKLTPLPTNAPAVAGVNPPSHLAIDATGRVLLAANYREGFVAAIPLQADGSLGTPQRVHHEGKGMHPTRQEKPHVHSVTLSPDNRQVIVADLGLDRVFSYALDAASARISPSADSQVAVAPGSGPRHFKFGASGRHGYVINELANTITAFDYDAPRGALAAIQTVPTLPPDFKGETTTAEIRVHPNGRFLYGSNRGHDSLAVFAIDAATGRLTPVEIVPSGGRTPRNFALSPDGKWLVCGHQDTPVITVFRVDAASGKLTRLPGTAEVPACVCVQFFD